MSVGEEDETFLREDRKSHKMQANDNFKEVQRLSVLADNTETDMCYPCCDNLLCTLEFQAKCCLFWSLFFSLLAAIFLTLGLSYVENKKSFDRFKETRCTLDGQCNISKAPIFWACSHSSRYNPSGEECYKWSLGGVFNASHCLDALCKYREESCAHAEEGPSSWTTQEQALQNCLMYKNSTVNKACWYDSSLQQVEYVTKCEADYLLPGVVYGPAWPRQWAYNLVVVGIIIAGIAGLLLLGGVGRMIQRCCQYGKGKRRQHHRHQQYRK